MGQVQGRGATLAHSAAHAPCTAYAQMNRVGQQNPLAITAPTPQVHVEGPYDILNDIICQRDKQFASHHRMAVIKKFYFMLQHLTQTDILLVHLHSFTSNPAHYTIPDPIR